MKLEKEILEDRQAKITVDYTTQEFEGFKRRAAKKIAKNAKIPGFRPGKAPYNVIVNHYGEGAILQEAIDIVLDDDYGKILDQAEIEPSGQGNLESIDSYDPPSFVFMVPMKPEVELSEYREIRKPYELEEFDINQVDDFITNLRRNSATIIPADHPAQEGNLVYFNLSGEFLNPEDDEDAVITDKTPQQVFIPEDDDISEEEWPYPGFAKELVGIQAGESKEIIHEYPKDHKNEAYQGKTAVFSVEVQSVKELELPEVDEEFVKSLGDYESPEKFRESVEERLRKEHQNSYDNEYFNELMEEIIENTKMNYPPQMLAHEEEHVLEDIKSRLENQNLEFDTFLKLRDIDEETFMEEEVRPAAKKRLERSLVMDALLVAEKIKLDQDLLQQQINEVMTEVFYSGNAKEMQKQMGNEEFSRVISMEGVQRTIDSQLKERLKLIATGQPIPEDEEEEDVKEEEEEQVEAEITGDETDVQQDLEKEVSSEDLDAALVDTVDEEQVEEDKDQSENVEESSEE